MFFFQTNPNDLFPFFDFSFIVIFLAKIKDFILPFSAFLLSVIGLVITIKNYLGEKACMLCFISGEVAQYQVDRKELNFPDEYWYDKFRCIPNVTITNNSSKPNTIFEFELGDRYKFNVYTQFQDEYRTTINPNKITTAPENSKKKPTAIIINRNLKKFALSPPISFSPYESKSGFLFFHYDKEFPEFGTVDLRFKTARGEFSFNIALGSTLRSLRSTYFVRPPLSEFRQEDILYVEEMQL